MSFTPYRASPTEGLKPWLPPLVVSALLWWFSANAITWREFAMAAILLLVPWYSYQRWRRTGTSQIPLFSLLALAYWAAFAMPLFLSTPPGDPQTAVPFKEPVVFAVLAMAVLGIGAMGVGMSIPFRPIEPGRMPDIVNSVGAWRYLYCVMALGTLLSVDEDWSLLLGTGGHQLMDTLATTVPTAVFAMLSSKSMDHEATGLQRRVIGLFVAVRVMVGIASGWLGSVVLIGIVLSLVYMSKHRRLPGKAILVIVPVVMFLQVGKGEFRERYWSEANEGDTLARVQFWFEASFRQWDKVFTHKEPANGSAMATAGMDRLALLPQAANVMEKTPGIVPFQDGASYSYLAATLIPRAVWPGKPSVNDANRFYQVAYGLTRKDALEGVSISVGCLTESFMNFGWWGVVGIMFAIGFLLGLFERTLLSPDSGLLFFGIGIGLVNGLMAVESQAAQYLGGMAQQIAVVFVVVLPIIQRRKSRYRRADSAAEALL